VVATETVLWALLSLGGGTLAGWVAVSESRRLRSGDVVSRSLSLPFVATAVTVVVAVAGSLLVPVVFGNFPSGYVFVSLLLFAVPWTVFSLRYAGWGSLVTTGRVAVASAIIVAALAGLLFVNVGGGLSSPLGSVFVAFVNILLLAIIGTMFVVSGLVVLSASRHGSVPTAAGVAVTLPVVETMVFGAAGTALGAASNRLFSGLFLVVLSATLVVATDYYGVLDARPGASVLGERTLMRELDEAVLVVDERDTVARANRSATRLFGSDIEGQRLQEVFGRSRDAFETDSLELWTDQGNRQFSPRVTRLPDGAAGSLGYAITLFDITDREIRRQRIQVLNRILRHNIRNDIDVIKAHSEQLAEVPAASTESAVTIQQTADQLATLSRDARQFEKLMRQSTERESAVVTADIAADAVEAVSQEWPEADVAVDAVSTPVAVSHNLVRYALQNLVENAVQHNESATPRVRVTAVARETHVEVTVADDGPGIPERERAVIESGGEDQYSHSTQFGLWSANWAVQAVGGEFDIGESDLGGAAVRVTLPRVAGDAPDDG
jgi:signal transduction histidine kinase